MAVILVLVWSPRRAEACSPGPAVARIHWPRADTVAPPHTTLWVVSSGIDPAQRAPTVELVDARGATRRVAVTAAPPLDELYPASGLSQAWRAELQLEPSMAYELRAGVGGGSGDGGVGITWHTIDFSTGTSSASVVPAPPAGELGFYSSGAPPGAISSCSVERANEFAIVHFTAGDAVALHARARYPGAADFEGDRLLLLAPPLAAGPVTFWASDRGLPCVELVAEGAAGLRSAPVVVCDPVGCTRGDGAQSGLSRGAAWWRALGRQSCVGGADAGLADASDPIAADAGLADGGANDPLADAGSPPLTEAETEGCGCRSAARGASGGSLLSLVLLALGLLITRGVGRVLGWYPRAPGTRPGTSRGLAALERSVPATGESIRVPRA